MNATEFFRRHPVFTYAQFAAEVAPASPSATESQLKYHVNAGHLLRPRRRLYVAIPPGSDPSKYPVDPFLLAGHLTSDAVLAYHSALGFYGKTYSVRHDFVYLTTQHARPFEFRGERFRARSFPKSLIRQGQQLFAVNKAERLGVDVRVTSLERTLVDVLDQPDLGGGWEEVLRSVEMIEFFDLNKVIEYALLLDVATTAAKVGWFLEQHREALSVTDEHLARLRERRPKEAHYVLPAKPGKGRFVANWNLIVPTDILDRSWEEPA